MSFLENENHFLKNWLKTQHFHTKLFSLKLMSRLKEYKVEYIINLSQRTEFCQTTLFSRKFNFSIRTSYKYLIWYTNYPDIQIYTFHKRSSFIWGCEFPVSIPEILPLKKCCNLIGPDDSYFRGRNNCCLIP